MQHLKHTSNLGLISRPHVCVCPLFWAVILWMDKIPHQLIGVYPSIQRVCPSIVFPVISATQEKKTRSVWQRCLSSTLFSFRVNHRPFVPRPPSSRFPLFGSVYPCDFFFGRTWDRRAGSLPFCLRLRRPPSMCRTSWGTPAICPAHRKRRSRRSVSGRQVEDPLVLIGRPLGTSQY